jgi:hypothetical protein
MMVMIRELDGLCGEWMIGFFYTLSPLGLDARAEWWTIGVEGEGVRNLCMMRYIPLER